MQDYEKLGLFYLGLPYDPEARATRDCVVLYDSRDLLTHAVCVGMTGSGKTGLCVALLEEAAIDGIPSIVVDPKGDLGNLLFRFPELRPEDFEPWVDAAEAQAAGLAPRALAERTAEAWRAGLAASGQGPDRIQRLCDAAEVALYTPGSSAGIPVSLLGSFGAPPEAVRADEELLQERVRIAAGALLGLVGVEADPLTSREHILLSTLLAEAWRAGRGLDLGALIRAIQSPPFARVGVLDLDAFFPERERFALAMRLNHLLASPAFAAWSQGDPLDVGASLAARDGRPRVAIYSIAHLSDAERMFFVTLLLADVLAWVRAQPGTGSLRAILFLDEVVGYLPPVANPPSKEPLLLLLKQARAFGLGVVLATQNPVDVDYKALSNAGTWWIGRLQTERDKLRVLDGLEGVRAGAGFDRARIDALLSGLEKRVFLMHDVHEDAPVVFKTRSTLSWLRGPLTRAEIRRLSQAGAAETGSARPEAARAAEPEAARAAPTAAAPRAAAAPSDAPGRPAEPAHHAQRPLLPPAVPQFFLAPRGSRPDGAELVYQPALLGIARVYHVDKKLGVEAEVVAGRIADLSRGALVDWASAERIAIDEGQLASEPEPQATFGALPPEAGKAKSYDGWRRAFVEELVRNERLELLRDARLGLVARPGEDEREFRARVALAAREARDREVEALRARWAPKLAALEERRRRARQAVEREAEQAREAKLGTWVSIGSTLLGAFLGRKVASSANVGRAASTARGVGRARRQAQDVERAQETLTEVERALGELDGRFREEVAAIEAVDATAQALERVTIGPKKTNVQVRVVALAWVPHWRAGERLLRAI